jgi:autotransporter-associated beta strand protein
MGQHLSGGNSGLATANMTLTGGSTTVFGNILEGDPGAGTITSTLTLDGGTLDLNGNGIGVAGSLIDNLNFQSGTLKNVATINGTGGLTKTTAGILIVEGTNPYSGDTTVTEGKLTLSNAAEAGNANTINDASSVNIAATGAELNLAYTGTDVVNELYIGGVLQAPGVWGAVGSGAPKQDSRITGTGTLTVATGSSGFTTWITGTFANGTVPEGLRGPNDDPDNDGIPNLVEYAIASQDPTVSNPTVGTYTGTTLSFDKRQPLASDITYAIQQSTDLGLVDNWEEVSGGSYTNNSTTISYTFTPGTPVNEFYRLSVTQNP